MAANLPGLVRAQQAGAQITVQNGRTVATYPDGRTEDLGEYEEGSGGFSLDPSDALKVAGKVEDKAFNAIGMTVDPAGPPPDPNAFFDTAEGSAAENYQRAKDAYDRARAFSAVGTIRDLTVTPGMVTAPDVEGPERFQAHDAGPIRETFATQVSRPEDVALGRLADVERVQGVDMGVADKAVTGPVQRAEINPRAGSMLEAAALGNAPSEAEAILRAGVDKNAQTQLGVAAQARGADRGGARREAILAIGQQGADLANQAAAMRAREMAEARGQFAQFSTQAAQLEQQANDLEAQIAAQIAAGNRDAANAMRTRQAELRQQAQQANATATNERTMQEADLRAGIQRGNIDARTAVDIRNAAAQDAANAANAAAANTRAENLAQRSDETDAQYAARLQAHRENRAAQDIAVQTGNRDANLAGQTTNATLARGKDTADIDRQIQEEQVRQSGQAAAAGAAQGATDTATTIGAAKLDAASAAYAAAKDRENQQRDARTQTKLKIIDTAAGKLPTKSDRDAKDAIEPVKGAGSLAEAYRKMASTWSYKDEPGVERSGPIAQDLAKHPLGKAFVHRDEDGDLAVDSDSAQWAVIKGLADKMHAITMRTKRRAA